jgi:hypothetical protein
METSENPLRDRLLAQHTPEPGRLAQYRKEVDAMLEQHEKTLRRQKWYAAAIWIYAVLLTTVFLTMSGFIGTPPGIVMSFLGIFLSVAAAVELLKYFLNRGHVEMLKEIKRLEIHVLELQEQLQRLAPR